ncbi:MAG: hypothetical protein CMB99_01630 [Flavobacteriaceae bacterium]|nr:hypothetical protein [Flavobacteriaceae bacterium]|tara:strand:+ start:28729 stop:30423 length:1695 start_codon:yes stop_codon:yes gene_type:complete
MKNLLFCFLVLLSYQTFSQCPSTGTVYLSNQSQVDNFIITYPSCAQYQGNITIQGGDPNDPVQSLDGLQNLTGIDGELNIDNFDHQLDISGMGQLTSLGTLRLTNLFDGFRFVGDFSKLKLISSNLIITQIYQKELDFSTNFTALEEVKGNYFISSNNTLEKLINPNNITSIGLNLEVSNNSKLKSIQGFANLESIDNDLKFIANFNLFEIPYFNSLVTLRNDFTVDRTNLENLIGFNNLENFDGNFLLQTNSNLKKIEGFSKLPEIKKSFTINVATMLSEISGFDNLTTVGVDFFIGSVSVSDFTSFNSLTLIENDLSLSSINDQSSTLVGFENLEHINGSCLLSDINTTDINVFNSLIDSQNLYILNCTFSSFFQLSSLISLKSLSIQNNPNLTDLSFFPNLESIDQDLDLFQNNALSQITGFDKLNSINGSLFIRNNALLSSCAIAAFCNHLSNNGNFLIQSNKSGCNSKSEILNDCASLSVPNNIDPIDYFRYNAHSKKLIINISRLKDQNSNVSIFSVLGKSLLNYTKLNEDIEIDLSAFSRGVYLLKINQSNFKFLID